jgi:hypothetical protein
MGSLKTGTVFGFDTIPDLFGPQQECKLQRKDNFHEGQPASLNARYESSIGHLGAVKVSHYLD